MITAALDNITKGAFRNLLLWIMALLPSWACGNEEKKKEKYFENWVQRFLVSYMQNLTGQLQRTTWV